MKKQGQVTALALIKNEAMQIKLILDEKQRKSAIGTNGTNGNPVLINQIMDEDIYQIEAIKGSNFRPQNYNQNQQGQQNQTN
jgi:hypothetical protein